MPAAPLQGFNLKRADAAPTAPATIPHTAFIRRLRLGLSEGIAYATLAHALLGNRVLRALAVAWLLQCRAAALRAALRFCLFACLLACLPDRYAFDSQALCTSH